MGENLWQLCILQGAISKREKELEILNNQTKRCYHSNNDIIWKFLKEKTHCPINTNESVPNHCQQRDVNFNAFELALNPNQNDYHQEETTINTGGDMGKQKTKVLMLR